MAVREPRIVDRIIPRRQVSGGGFNFTPGRNGNFITSIVLHTYNGAGTSLFNWFAYSSPGTSSTYAVFKDGTIERYVSDDDTAHHAGKGDTNIQSIGIEHQDDGNPYDSTRTPELYESSARLVAWLSEKHNVPLQYSWHGILKHKDVTDTGCPGGLDTDRIINRAKEIQYWESGWKKDVSDIGLRTYYPEKAFDLYNIDTGAVVGSYPHKTMIEVRYRLGEYMMTDFSYNNNIKNGFKISDLEYKEPVVIPDPEPIPDPIPEPEPQPEPEEPVTPQFNLIKWLINLLINLFKRK